MATSVALKDLGPSPRWAAGGASNPASRSHHPAARKRMRARSRSTRIRVATLWTLPAERRGMTFFHRTGETS